MGLYVDTVNLRQLERWPSALVAAVEDMQIEANGKSVVAALAAKLIVRHIAPLKPELTLSEQLSGRATWSTLMTLGKTIEMESMDRLGLCIGSALIQIQGWSSKRNVGMCQTTYCQVCWRHALEGRRYCEEHDPYIKNGNYKAACRLLLRPDPSFLNKAGTKRKGFRPKCNLLTEAVINLRQLDGTQANMAWDSVQYGMLSLDAWMMNYRPQVYTRIRQHFPYPVAISPNAVLECLDTVSAGSTTPSSQVQRSALHMHILQHPDELFGLLRRAEAYLHVESAHRKERPHGGKRQNAGRPTKKKHQKKGSSRDLMK